jgi:HK97 family phage major capsid protein
MNDFAQLATTIENINVAFEAYKSANDERLAEIKKGGERPETRAKVENIDSALNDLAEMKRQVEALSIKAARPDMGSGEKVSREVESYKNAFIRSIRGGLIDNEANQHLQQAYKELKKASATERETDKEWKEWSLERRAAEVITSTPAAGGFAVPEQISREITRLTLDISPIRSISKVVTAGTSDYKELVELSNGGSGWVGEGDARPNTTTPDFSEIIPTWGMVYGRPRATEESLEDMFFDVEAWMVEQGSEKIAEQEGVAFISGNGTKRPTGFLAGPAPVLTNDKTRAFGTLQCFVSGAAATLPATADPFVDMVFGLRAKYRRRAKWVMNKATLSVIRKYKETTGDYLFKPGFAVGVPDSFMGYGIVEAEDMPDVAANAFPVAFGDFKEGYLIADRPGFRLTRDDITQPGYVSLYLRRRVGGRLLNTQAIKLLRVSAT